MIEQMLKNLRGALPSAGNRSEMARPKSDEKRRAILEATLRVVAERGIENAPTAAISKEAGVAEGTLFTYFRTKDELMNALYVRLREDFDAGSAEYPAESPVRERLRFVWDRFLNLGIRQPYRIEVLRRLRASGRLLRENEEPGGIVRETLESIREAAGGGVFAAAPLEFMALLLRGGAEATVEFILAHPEEEGQCRELGFELVWQGLTGQPGQ